MRAEELKKQAREGCLWRKHTMTNFKRTGDYTFISTCKKCGMYVQIDTNPPPNGIDIGGTAIALNCEKGE